jgi:hypothetical protein
MNEKVLFISDKTISVLENGICKNFTSDFITEYCKNQESIIRKRAWKNEGFGAMFRHDAPMNTPDMVDHLQRTASITGISFLNNREVIYAVSVGDTGGLFKGTFEKGCFSEGHIVHDRDVYFESISCSKAGRVAFAVRKGGIESHIAILNDGTAYYSTITEGESIDTNPSWDPNNPQVLFYDSASLGYNNKGTIVKSSRSIFRIDFDSQQNDELVCDHNFDFFSPQLDSNGHLYCIKRPYQDLHRSTNMFTMIGDIFMMPFKIGKAVYKAIEMFTVKNTGERLTTSGPNPAKIKAAEENIHFDGVVIDPFKTLEENQKIDNTLAGIIPKNWELVKIEPGEKMTTIAKGICSFSVKPDNSIIYSNGKYLFSLKNDKKVKLAEALLPTKIIVQ